jgi:Predicted esterase of the alpha/beta hydrolase fold
MRVYSSDHFPAIPDADLCPPIVLTVPGIDNSGPGHWQSLWERERDDCFRVELGSWEQPRRNLWVTKLGSAIAAASRPVVLVAHSLGCHAVGWWNALEQPLATNVVGALLVAPPEVEDQPIDERLRPFGPVARRRLPFPSLLVASRDDPYASFGRAKRMARIWGSRLIDAGPVGHINVASGVRDWPYGQFLLRRLIAAVTPERRPLIAGGAAEYFARPSPRQVELRL